MLPLLACVVLTDQAHAKSSRVILDQSDRRIAQIDKQDYILKGSVDLTLTHDKEPILSGKIDFKHEDAAVIIRHVKPSDVLERYLKYIYINGKRASIKTNVRLTPYGSGTIILPHGPNFRPFQAYLDKDFEGESLNFQQHTYYKSQQLGRYEDEIASFILKRGYMATMAENEDGTGVSKVFIADKGDLEVSQLPKGLRGKVSFVRVFPWRWTGKKGFGGRAEVAEKLGALWSYNWSAKGLPTIDREYVPMKFGSKWPKMEKVNSMTGVTHLLGYNEPMQKDQANMTMEEALGLWPQLQQSGLRLGSPCPTDGAKGLDWLYRFIDESEKRGYRVDFIAIHMYKPDWTEQRLVKWLRTIHKRTGGRPLWVTEYNNGGPWVKGHNPTLKENADRIERISAVMQRLHFVERYAVFSCPGNRQIIRDSGELTPAGIRYRDSALLK